MVRLQKEIPIEKLIKQFNITKESQIVLQYFIQQNIEEYIKSLYNIVKSFKKKTIVFDFHEKIGKIQFLSKDLDRLGDAFLYIECRTSGIEVQDTTFKNFNQHNTIGISVYLELIGGNYTIIYQSKDFKGLILAIEEYQHGLEDLILDKIYFYST